MAIDHGVDTQALEDQIRSTLGLYPLDGFLWVLRQAAENLEPFQVAGVALFAVRFCAPAASRIVVHHRHCPPLTVVADVAHRVMLYLLADPVSLTPPLESSATSILLRTVGNQFPFDEDHSGQQARALIMFDELPRVLEAQPNRPRFDFAAAFKRINQVSVADFVAVGFTCFAAAHSNIGFTRDYFNVARQQGITLPDDEAVSLVLNQLSAGPDKLKNLYEAYKQKDRRFAAYDFNPLFPFPIVRPWTQKEVVPAEKDRMIAPLPNLIPWRISTGI